MKKYIKEFLLRGLVACAGGPVVLAIIYGILGACGEVETVSTLSVCREIFTITLMAFLAAGVTMVYQVEELPLFLAILIHGVVLYLDYLIIYLVNGWIAEGIAPLLIFTAVFVAGYALIWAFIYAVTRRNAKQINLKLLNSNKDQT